MCLYPKIIRNRKYTVTNKNDEKYGKGNVPIAKDKRVLYVPIGCGKCMECKKQKKTQWQVRLQEDLKENKNGKFVTFTYSNEGLKELENLCGELEGYDRDNEVCRIAIRRFLERWRKEHKKSVRHWLVTEIGGRFTERIHIHGILWTDEGIEEIRKRWKYGHVILGDGKKHYVNEQTINYIVKYINKTDEKHKEYNSKVFTSKGIGKNYMQRKDIERNRYIKGKTIETYKTRKGLELGLPIYYRNYIYSDEEKEKLWIEKLDKELRYVDGVEVDVKEGYEEYYKLLEVKRQKNKRLGYGDDSENWDLKEYEKQRRNMKYRERHGLAEVEERRVSLHEIMRK